MEKVIDSIYKKRKKGRKIFLKSLYHNSKITNDDVSYMSKNYGWIEGKKNKIQVNLTNMEYNKRQTTTKQCVIQYNVIKQ